MTEVAVRFALSALESQAGRLNEISDEVNKKLTEIENRIVSLNIGLEFWYSVPVHRDDSVGTFSYDDTTEQLIQVLGFARVDNKWCIAVKPIKLVKGFFEGDYNCPFENPYAAGKVVPLLQSSRDLRIASLAAMQDFLTKLTEHVQSVNRTIEKTTT